MVVPETPPMWLSTACCEVEWAVSSCRVGQSRVQPTVGEWQMNGCVEAGRGVAAFPKYAASRHAKARLRAAQKGCFRSQRSGALWQPRVGDRRPSSRAARGDLSKRNAQKACWPDDDIVRIGESRRGDRINRRPLTPLRERRQRPARRRAGAGRELRRSLRGHHGEG